MGEENIWYNDSSANFKWIVVVAICFWSFWSFGAIKEIRRIPQRYEISGVEKVFLRGEEQYAFVVKDANSTRMVYLSGLSAYVRSTLVVGCLPSEMRVVVVGILNSEEDQDLYLLESGTIEIHLSSVADLEGR